MALEAICKTQDVASSSGPLNGPSSGPSSESEVYARLTNIFRDTFDEDVSLTPRTTAQDMVGWDSFAHFRLVLAIETEFKIRFSSSEMERMLSVGGMVALILRRRLE